LVSARARSISSSTLERRSHAIAFSQATESTGVHFSGVPPPPWSFRMEYSRLRSEAFGLALSQALTPLAYASR
jgi:hypothetical protein